ncbi:MAG: PspA/IM30 family protein [Eggerthellaceae bacterium]|uniref:Phage shock protein A (PspA) family protein n=1 Tax=Denitrobacterium detoxificans TaxID=79604 RepID=A0A172RY04_9ACTN|nr:PspA/IM30 family protein [Denitrobacterium detoxificans]ANE22610.1 phage-shock protein [Denitrobacterium detoxificans]MCR5582336.1 PspA/IM30 family protein [Eggerthellaceae bacterium]SEO91935.1 phage shock protein A (PspA) family protein [Denitrobacterium detoxificans]
MAIFQRITDILKANINDMLDKAEDPEKMVKQIIIEMSEQVDSATEALGQAMGSQKLAARQLEEAKRASADWQQKAELALKSGNEELARRALDSKVGVDRQIAEMQQQYDALSAQVDKLKDQVKVLKQKLDEARARQDILIARSRMADAQQGVATAVGAASSTSAFSKLDKLEQKVAQKEATAEAFTELNGMNVDPTEDEFAKLQHAADVDAEMAALKAKLGM